MKLWYREQNFLRNILKLKQNPFVPSAHAQMTHFEAWSGFRYQLSHIWHFKTTSQFPKLETRFDLESFPRMSPSQKNLIGDVIFNFADVSKNWFLVCKLHTSIVTQLMKPLLAINSQRLSLIQILTSYYMQNLRCQVVCSSCKHTIL